jgi:DNA repair exonuclease SbcCD ATPase subunit
MVNCIAMNPSPYRAPAPDPHTAPPAQQEAAMDELMLDQEFNPLQWSETQAEAGERNTGGRTVLGVALTLLATAWLGYTAWSAGRAIGGLPLSSPQIAQWVAVAAGPLALLGLVWIMFGRTRRKEAEKFTRSVIQMRTEARSLEGLLGVLSQRISESHQALGSMAQQLMTLGDEATGRMGNLTREFDSSSDRLVRNSQLFDRAAESARNDMAVMLDDLPRAEALVKALGQELRGIGSESATRATELGAAVSRVSEQTQEADEVVAAAAQRLVAHLTQIESAGAAAAARVGEAEASFSTALDSLLDRTAGTLDEIRRGVDAQSAAVVALVEEAAAGLGRTGIDAANALGTSVSGANAALDGLSARVAEQERASQRMVAEIDRGLALIDQRFTALAANGDERANRFLASLTRARTELDNLSSQSGSQDDAVAGLLERTSSLREALDALQRDIGEAQGGADRLLQSAQAARPEIGWLRDAAAEAHERVAEAGAGIADQQQRFAAFLSAFEEGAGTADARLAEMRASIAAAREEAARLSNETGPSLVAALVQVREAAGHAAERAREAITAVIPEAAGKLSDAAREALERVIRESIEERLRGVESAAANAVESARAASDRLTAQMLSLGQTATALERHMEETATEQREKDSETFARRVAMLMDSMNSAAIDVGKILSDEVDEKAWDSYLKGNRGVFTRRAVRLMDGSETRAIRAHYDSDGEFQQSVNRYVHDFEAMLRRVLGERDGGVMAVTLMSSDMGKLYAALAQVIERKR